jgi:glycosyltransferase involved in cell wall biosynthesis
VPYEDVPALFAKASVAVFPSTWESFGYVALEAMAAGRAIVASSAGGMAEIIDDGRTGVLVPPRDPAAIAKAILGLLNDPAKAADMGIAARAQALTTYGPDMIGPLHEASLRRAIDAANARKLRWPR